MIFGDFWWHLVIFYVSFCEGEISIDVFFSRFY